MLLLVAAWVVLPGPPAVRRASAALPVVSEGHAPLLVLLDDLGPQAIAGRSRELKQALNFDQSSPR